VDDEFNLEGLITIKDKYPIACKDEKGRLRIGAAIGVGNVATTEAMRGLIEAVEIPLPLRM
jgi:IMP dehydrogenase